MRLFQRRKLKIKVKLNLAKNSWEARRDGALPFFEYSLTTSRA
nr:MAG TPA: hypothetical protein [Caudoviricetes sp.]